MQGTNKTKVIVVGGGLAGLTAAYRLHTLGYDVQLYEARKRLGGRILTVNLCDHIVELGGQNILNGGEANNILSLINELELETQSNKAPHQIHYFDGCERVDPNVLLKSYNFTHENLVAKFEEISPHAKNMHDVLVALFKDNDILIKYFSALLSAYEGLAPELLSLDAVETLHYMLLGGLSFVHQNPTEDRTYIEHLWVKGGNARLIEKLADKISRERIHLDSPLTSIETGPANNYLLTFKNSSTATADIVVLAIPCTVYQDIEFKHNTIPAQRLMDINSIQYGTNSKILIPVTGIHKEISNTNGCSVTFVYPEEFNTACLYYVGAYGIFDQGSIHDSFKRDLPLIEQTYSIINDLQEPVVADDKAYASYSAPIGYSWPNDRYAKGSYSCITVDQKELFTSIQSWNEEKIKTLFTPINNRLFFAGEHTSILLEVDGTMEAAVESGERTARLIISTLAPA